MKKILLQTIILFVFSWPIFAQVVTTNPTFPIENQAVILTFHADRGNGELADFSGDIWAHTGVITNNSSSGSDWKHVIAGWSENTDKAKLTRISANIYELEISPSILEFYDVTGAETIEQMAMVFRNSDGSKVGRDDGGSDVFIDVYEPGLEVDIISPINGQIVDLNQTITVEVNAMEAQSLQFYINDELIGDYPAAGFTYDYLLEKAGKTTFKVAAIASDETVWDSVYIYAMGDIQAQALPTGMRDGVNYLNDNSVLLSLLAPGKEYVFAIGDYSNWEVTDEVRMIPTPDGERFWLQIDGLEAGHPYIYQYYIDGELKMADVYGEQISDPWNDSYIPEEIFPNLPDYPEGQTTGLASVFTTAQEAYEWQVTDFQAPKITDMVIYEVLIRDISEDHSFQFLIDTLSYFKNLGINTIELMPINEFEGNSSWGYNPSFYFAVDKYYGTKNKLKEFIDLCHANDIAVVIDMVLNHSFNQNPQVQMYWNAAENRPAADNPWFNEVSPNQSYHWGSDYNHESAYTEAFVDSVNTFWMTEFKVDGFRFDFTKGFTNTPGDGWPYDASRITILQRMANAIWDVNEDAYVIFEHLADNSEEKVLANSGILLWGNMNFKYKEANMGYNTSDKSDLSWGSYQKRNWNDPHLVAYMESHDEERQMVYNNSWGNSLDWYDVKNESIGLERIAMSTLFHLAVPGPKMYWQFGELGFDLSINWPSGEDNDRLTPKPPKWEYQSDWRRKYLHDLTASLNKLKAENDTWET
ncbi:MAG: Por secretion system protein, partial [Bacteroidales bacterium]|nr:Por secretion system protein [Bacteroidales bacterium]